MKEIIYALNVNVENSLNRVTKENIFDITLIYDSVYTSQGTIKAVEIDGIDFDMNNVISDNLAIVWDDVDEISRFVDGKSFEDVISSCYIFFGSMDDVYKQKKSFEERMKAIFKMKSELDTEIMNAGFRYSPDESNNIIDL